MAINYGAAAIGLVSQMPSGPGVIGIQKIREIAQWIPPAVSSFLLTSQTKSREIISDYEQAQTTTIQLVDELESNELEVLRKSLPNVKLVQVIHVIDNSSVLKAIEISKYVDAILLDSGNPNLAIKELGGTGRTHNWKLSREIREAINIPLFLAGGLNKDNVNQAIREVEPFGIDLCSGVRTNGSLDEEKLMNFFNSVS